MVYFTSMWHLMGSWEWQTTLRPPTSQSGKIDGDLHRQFSPVLPNSTPSPGKPANHQAITPSNNYTCRLQHRKHTVSITGIHTPPLEWWLAAGYSAVEHNLFERLDASESSPELQPPLDALAVGLVLLPSTFSGLPCAGQPGAAARGAYPRRPGCQRPVGQQVRRATRHQGKTSHPTPPSPTRRAPTQYQASS
jgi:hypothetical protein